MCIACMIEDPFYNHMFEPCRIDEREELERREREKANAPKPVTIDGRLYFKEKGLCDLCEEETTFLVPNDPAYTPPSAVCDKCAKNGYPNNLDKENAK